MMFIAKLAALAVAAATAVSATNTIQFVNQDSTTRSIIFTPSSGHAAVSTVEIAGLATKTVTIPTSWIGNWYSVSKGASNTVGMLGEVTFQGWGGITYFDVSAIVNAADHVGVKQIYPASEASASTKSKISGCTSFPCNTAYYLADDVQTVTTTETALVCTLGTASSGKRAEEGSELVARKYVLGQF
jgi:hypothetical protein